MNKNIIIRTLIETVIGWVLLALLLCMTKDITFAQALLTPCTITIITIMVSAFVGACIAYRRKALKKQEKG